jgi:hypothetical protein
VAASDKLEISLAERHSSAPTAAAAANALNSSSLMSGTRLMSTWRSEESGERRVERRKRGHSEVK